MNVRGDAAVAHALTGALTAEASGWVAPGLAKPGHQAASPGGYQGWRQEIRDLWQVYRGPAGEIALPGRDDLDDAEADTAGLGTWDASPGLAGASRGRERGR
jgi:hypothetical protein